MNLIICQVEINLIHQPLELPTLFRSMQLSSGQQLNSMDDIYGVDANEIDTNIVGIKEQSCEDESCDYSSASEDESVVNGATSVRQLLEVSDDEDNLETALNAYILMEGLGQNSFTTSNSTLHEI